MNMKTLHNCLLALATGLGSAAQAADKVDYAYMAAPGVHESKMFHGCYGEEDQTARTKVNLVMTGLAMADVELVERAPQSGKPSTEMFTLRVKGHDASIKTLFRSNDGPHCQQGVHSITFTDATLHSAAQLKRVR